jgi:hypothetical protein
MNDDVLDLLNNFYLKKKAIVFIYKLYIVIY